MNDHTGVHWGMEDALKKRAVFRKNENFTAYTHDEMFSAFRREGWSAVKIPYWADNTDTTHVIKEICNKLARKKCWHLINFNNIGSSNPSMNRYVLFRYRKHAWAFLQEWMKARTPQFNKATTGYYEGSKVAFQEALREKWGHYVSLIIKRKFYFRGSTTWLEIQQWFKDNGIEHYAFDSKEQTWYFQQHKDAVLFKMMWNDA